MTKKYQTTVVKRESRATVEITCDWCGKVIPLRYQECGDTKPETEINFREIHSCFESYWAEGWVVDDLCMECGWKLSVALTNLGINVRNTGPS